jgi:hypothetical protein
MPNKSPRRASGETPAKISKGKVGSSPAAALDSPRLDRIASSSGPTAVSGGRKLATRRKKASAL